jgi:hypothetical protein
MTPQEQEKIWRDRFIAVNLVRIGGTLVALFGVYLSATDTLQEGGAMIPGLALAVAGLVAAFGGPLWLARKWRTPPGP